MQSPQPSQRLAWNCRVLKHLPTIKPLTPDLRHQTSPGQLWIGDEFGFDWRQIGAAQDELPHDAGVDEIVDRRDANQMSVLEHDVPVTVLAAAFGDLGSRSPGPAARNAPFSQAT